MLNLMTYRFMGIIGKRSNLQFHTFLKPILAATSIDLRIKPINQFYNFNNEKSRSLSTSSGIAVPSNLLVDDLSLLEPREEDYLKEDEKIKKSLSKTFPQLPSQVPSQVDVWRFASLERVASTPLALSKLVFGVGIRKDIVLNLVRYLRNKRRQPKKTKRMSEIRGSNKKPRPQKGGGTGQVGHRRNSAWRGGQKAHGPVIRDYSIQINKKVRALGMMMTLAAKYREGNLLVVDSFEVETHRTKEVYSFLTAHGVENNLSLLVDDEFPTNFIRASQNLPKALSIEVTHLNAYDVLLKEKLIITSRALEKLQSKLEYQYLQGGKQRSQVRALDQYEKIVWEGKKILASAPSSSNGIAA